MMEFHISRQARERYRFAESLFSYNGNVVFASIAACREFAHRMKFGTVQYSEAFVEWLLACHREDASFFEDATRFPEGSATLDSAMLMLGVPVRWYPQHPLDAPGPVAAPVADP